MQSKPSLCNLKFQSVCAIVAALGAAVAATRAAEAPTQHILVITDSIDTYTEGRSRLTNLLDGMGLAFDQQAHNGLAKVDWARYQLAIVAPTSDREFKIDEATEQQILGALQRGVNVLWIGRGIWGTFRSTDLPDAFGIKYLQQGWSSDARAVLAGYTNLAGEPHRLTVYKDMLYCVEATKARVDGWFSDEHGVPLKLPFLTSYRAKPGSGQAVYVAMPILNFWKSAESSDSYSRPEVLFKAIRRLTDRGTVGKHPAAFARDGVFILRLEDYTPGGVMMAHTGRLWLIRMQRLLEIAAQHQVPVNVALIPVYRHPFRNETHDWADPDPAIQTLRALAERAFRDGGSLIVHGYAHQLGTGPDNFSGDDWEMWDEANQRFLHARQQNTIAASAMAEAKKQWGVTPTIWETPHYVGNAETTRAVQTAGFKCMTESDTKIFPNRDGYLNRAQGLLLNIPETAFNLPRPPDELRASSLNRQNALLPQLLRMNGLFYVFYHNQTTQQERALENLLADADRYDLWKPNLERYAQFWERREGAKVHSTMDSAARRITARVDGAFEGFTLSIRLPDGAVPATLTIDGTAAPTNARFVDEVWYVRPVLRKADKTHVVVTWRWATSPDGLK